MSAECNKCGFDLRRTIDDDFFCTHCMYEKEKEIAKIFEEALIKIASYEEGPKVTPRFDNPVDAKFAREVLKTIRKLRGVTNDPLK